MFSYIYLLYIGHVSYYHIANVNAQVTLQSNNVMPTPGNSLTLSCLIQDVVNDNAITWYRPKSDTGTSPVCLRQSEYCIDVPPGYAVTANQSGAYLEITSINRDQDEGTWKCGYSGSDGMDTVRTLNITVYTLPLQLVYTKDVQSSTDLIVSNLSLQCKTSGCTYPPPVIIWYYKTQTSPVFSGVYHVGIGMTSEEGSCSSQEKLYTSTLQIPLYTTWSDNSDKIVTFYCGIQYPDPLRNIQSVDSGTVRFAVAVTSVILSISASEVVFYEGYPQMLTCISSPSRPFSTIRWFLGSRLLTDNITTTNVTDSIGLYILTSQIFLTLMRNASNQQLKCEGFIDGQQAVTSVEKPSVNVWYKPSKPMVREYGGASSGFPWLENMTGTLQCYSSDYGNPVANVTWFSDRGVMDSMNNLVITGLMPSDDKRNISCKLFNKLTYDKNIDVLSDPVMLNVEYHPIVKYNASNYLLLNETQSISVLCEVVGNPNPQSVQWKSRLNGSMLRFDNVSRIDKGTYTCEATARSIKYGTLTGQKQMNIIVQYAPDVSVDYTGSSIANSTVLLTCTAFGVPSQYTFHKWVHKVGETEIRRLTGINIVNTSILTLPNISFEDMGTYVCTVDNSITGQNGQTKQTEHTDIFVRGTPFIENKKSMFIGMINKSARIEIHFYSNPSSTTVKFYKGDNVEVTNTTDTLIVLSFSLNTFTFYGTEGFLNGQIAVLHFRMVKTTDYGEYKAVLLNDIGNITQHFVFNPGEPETPANFHVTDVQEKQVTLQWLSGDHRGFDQTFVVQISMDNITWTNASLINAGKKEGWFSATIIGLKSNTFYYFRLYSFNVNGWGDFADITFATRTLKESASSLDIGASLGIGFGGFFLGIVGTISVIIIRKRITATPKYNSTSEGDMSTDMQTYANTRVSSSPAPSHYEDLQQDNMEKTIYDRI